MGQIIFALLFIKTEDENETWSILKIKYFFDESYQGFVIFVVNIVMIKIHFNQLIMQSKSSEECDLLKTRVNNRVKLIKILSAIFIIITSLITIVVKNKLDDNNIKYQKL